MEEELISFETAKLAKEKGFNTQCWQYYDNGGLLVHSITKISNQMNLTSVPTQSLLQKWLREVHNLEVLISRIPPEAVLANKNKGKNILKNYNCYVWSFNNNPRIANNGSFQDIYEEALEIGLYQALKLIK